MDVVIDIGKSSRRGLSSTLAPRLSYTDSGEMFEHHTTELGFDARRLFFSMFAAVLLLAVAGLIATLTGGGDYFFIWAFGLAMTIAIVWRRSRDAKRTKEIREFASRRGLTYIGAALPKSFPLHRTATSGARFISRACAGEMGRNEILFFDCELGYGKGRFNRTVVAVLGESADFGAARFGPDLLTEEVGRWTLVYGSQRLLEIAEIDELVYEASQHRISTVPPREC